MIILVTTPTDQRQFKPSLMPEVQTQSMLVTKQEENVIDLNAGAFSSIGIFSEADQVSYWATTLGVSNSAVQAVVDTLMHLHPLQIAIIQLTIERLYTPVNIMLG